MEIVPIKTGEKLYIIKIHEMKKHLSAENLVKLTTEPKSEVSESI